jgi:hypothetical protein
VVDALIDRINRHDWDAIEELVHPDYVEEYPQSGERIRGSENLRKILVNDPGGLEAGGVDPQSVRVVADEERWVMTPTFTVLRVVAASDVSTVTLLARYADGSEWYMIGLWELKDGRLWRGTTYYAPRFEAPEWRAPYVERM